PQRFEFRLLDGVCMVDLERQRIVAYADIRSEDWWVRGHVPNRPLLPGVLMLEMAAQASAVLAKLRGCDAFIGFGGVDNCKFRETVVPPARLFIIGVGVDFRPRRIVSDTQGVMDGKLVFEARITGLTIR
ncbi:MAG: 3-hydroxyacyl-ACP dehydratase FabZ family protein, partial [Planctomycetota bacterium]